MNPRSERIVVSVSPAQKRVLAARAARLGVSVSELVRRALLAFDETGGEVRAAGLVDRLAAARSQGAAGDAPRRLVQRRTPEAEPPGAAQRGLAAARLGQAGARSNGRAAPRAAQGETRGGLPVAAAVARALEAAAQAKPADSPDPDDEARVARVIANESRDLRRF